MWDVIGGNPDLLRALGTCLAFVVLVRLRPWRVLSRLGRHRG